jgi:hypothetical protein
MLTNMPRDAAERTEPAAAGAMVLDLRGMPLPRQQEDWVGLPA